MSDLMVGTHERDDRPAAYVEDGVAIYRASAVGLCEEALVSLRMGVQPAMPPDWMLEKFEEGAEWEGYIVETATRNRGLHLQSSQDTAAVVVMENVVIRGSTDGSAQQIGGMQHMVGVEAKKLGPRLYEEWDKGLDNFWDKCPYYRDQLTVYMEGTGFPFLYAVGQWDVEQKKVVKVHTRMIEQPPGSIEAIKDKIRRVEERARDGDLGTCDGKTSWPCPVYFLHEEKERASVEGDVREEMGRLSVMYVDAQQLEKRAKEAKDEARGMLMELLAENGYVDLEAETVNEPEVVDGIKVTPFFRSNTRLDKKAMKADGIDVEAYETTTTSVALKVTRMED